MRYYGKIHSKLPIFRVKSVKIYTGQFFFTQTPPVVSVTNMWYVQVLRLGPPYFEKSCKYGDRERGSHNWIYLTFLGAVVSLTKNFWSSFGDTPKACDVSKASVMSVPFVSRIQSAPPRKEPQLSKFSLSYELTRVLIHPLT